MFKMFVKIVSLNPTRFRRIDHRSITVSFLLIHVTFCGATTIRGCDSDESNLEIVKICPNPDKVQFLRLNNGNYSLNDGNTPLARIEQKQRAKLTNLWNVYLSGNQIKFLNNETFAQMNSLRLISIDNNTISEIGADTFKNLSHLMNLYLDKNMLEYISENAFCVYNRLKYLDLRYNRLDDVNFIRVLKPLIYLRLSSNMITTLDEDIFSNLPNLQYLELDYNSIEKLPINLFRNQRKLIQVNLSHNQIMQIETGTFTIGFRELLINDNKLKVSAALNNITEINLERNFLKEFPLPENNVTVLIDGNQWDCEFIRRTYAAPNIHLEYAFENGTKNIQGIPCQDWVEPVMTETVIETITILPENYLLVIACIGLFFTSVVIIILCCKRCKSPNSKEGYSCDRSFSPLFAVNSTTGTESGYLTPKCENIYEEIRENDYYTLPPHNKPLHS